MNNYSLFLDAMVLIGKLSGVKPTSKREEDAADPKVPKLPKPPKPGAERKAWQGNVNYFTFVQNKFTNFITDNYGI